MSLLDKYLRGWSFRTSSPVLQPGSEIDIFLAEYDRGQEAAIAYVGDTRLYVDDVAPDHIGRQVRVAVREFKPDESVGYGEFIEVVGESSYAG